MTHDYNDLMLDPSLMNEMEYADLLTVLRNTMPDIRDLLRHLDGSDRGPILSRKVEAAYAAFNEIMGELR